MKQTFYLLLIALAISGTTNAQSISQVVMGNSGETLSGASNTLSFTVGEPVIGTISNSETLGQGFWLGAVEELVLSTNDFTASSAITAYPNPVIDELHINFQDLGDSDFTMSLFSIDGKMILQQEVSQSTARETINFSLLSTGSYLLKITQNNNSNSKTFKIIKQ